MSDFGSTRYPLDNASAYIAADTPNDVQRGCDSGINSSGGGGDSNELPSSPSSSDLYSVLESAMRAQMDALAVHSPSQRGHDGNSKQTRNGDDDDGLDTELSRLGDAELAMREELAAAVMEFGRSFPTATTAGTAGIRNTASASSSVPAQEASSAVADTVTNASDSSNHDYSDIQISAVSANDVSAQPHDHQREHNGRQQEQERPKRGKSEAELIDERELNSALEALCRWIRHDDSLLLGEPDRLQRKQQQKQMRHQRPRLPGETTTTARFGMRSSRTVATGTIAVGSSSNRNRDERKLPKSPRNSQRASRNTAVGACSDGYQPSTSTGRAQLKDLEQRIPMDELCKWLSESSGSQFGNSRQEAIPHSTGSSTVATGGTLPNAGRHVQQQKQDEEDTPSTFHLHSGGSSSLIVLGAMGNIIKAPKGRSPLRKNAR